MKKTIALVVLVCTVLLTTGCVSLGQQIDYNKVATIQRNVTTESDIRAMFGEPVTTRFSMKRGLKTLTYGYKNDDSIKRAAAGTAGAAAGGALGSRVGRGTGSVVGGVLGSLAGGILASNAVTARNERQYLEVIVNIKTQKVVDFEYTETKGRSQKLGVTSGVQPL